jgi:Txe/YoeB family toxin of Txe-Axe toxin-antitoxin module
MEDEEFKKNLDIILAKLDRIEWKAKKKLEKAQELKECLDDLYSQKNKTEHRYQ